MALSNLQQTENKWALLADRGSVLFLKLGNIDYHKRRIGVEEVYQERPPEAIDFVDFDSTFDKKAIICRRNIVDWLRIFYPDLQKVL